MDMRIQPLKFKILLESNPLKSKILVRRLAVRGGDAREIGVALGEFGDGEGPRERVGESLGGELRVRESPSGKELETLGFGGTFDFLYVPIDKAWGPSPARKRERERERETCRAR